MSQSTFQYFSFDVSNKLPPDWQSQIRFVAAHHAVTYNLKPGSVTSREASTEEIVKAITVDGKAVRDHLPWLDNLYRGLFRNLGQSCFTEQITPAREAVYGANLNIQRGNLMRYECHVDSNPVQGLLYVTTHACGDGGELAVSNNPEAKGTTEIDEDCILIHPKAGQLIFFDARRHPHYVRPLTTPTGERISVAMNYYTLSSPEEHRPADLNPHLFTQFEKRA